MSRRYDSDDMMRAINALDSAISEVSSAINKLDSISLGSLTGNTRNAMQEQLNSQRDLLNAQLKTLQQSRSTIQSKWQALQ
ncbi:MAG TPA: hypothetical protein IAC36_09280 [Candidatus Aphodomonas merdavium]|nr:hypothetical protein [Candidatus Aphodomonas merdavium]